MAGLKLNFSYVRSWENQNTLMEQSVLQLIKQLILYSYLHTWLPSPLCQIFCHVSITDKTLTFVHHSILKTIFFSDATVQT